MVERLVPSGKQTNNYCHKKWWFSIVILVYQMVNRVVDGHFGAISPQSKSFQLDLSGNLKNCSVHDQFLIHCKTRGWPIIPIKMQKKQMRYRWNYCSSKFMFFRLCWGNISLHQRIGTSWGPFSREIIYNSTTNISPIAMVDITNYFMVWVVPLQL